jgi:hypothetical protein
METAIGVFAQRDRAEEAVSAGVVAATALAIPGIGPVFALGFGAAALLGLVGAGTGAAVGQSAAHDSSAPSPTTGEASAKDSTYFREVLSEGTL